MSKWQAIVFDLDDTLYPERGYVFSGFRAVAAWADAELGIPLAQGTAELHELFALGVRGDTFNRWLAAHGLADQTLVRELVRVYQEHQPVLDPFPEVPRLLESLDQPYRLGLVSDGYLAVQQRKLAALGLSPFFDAVVFSDRWGRAAWKPSPRSFQAVLQQLDVEAGKSVYVADNPTKDFLGARRAGMATIWIRWTGGEYTHLTPPTVNHAPHLTVASLGELERVIVAQDGRNWPVCAG